MDEGMGAERLRTPEPGTTGGGRRAVLDEARRKVERALMVTEAADHLAAAVDAYLEAAGAPEGAAAEMERLQASLASYRRVRAL